MFVCNSVSVYLWQKTNFVTLRSRDFIFGILHIQIMKQFKLPVDLDLYSNIANLNFAATCGNVYQCLIDIGKKVNLYTVKSVKCLVDKCTVSYSAPIVWWTQEKWMKINNVYHRYPPVQYHTPKVLLLWACIHKLRGFRKTLGQERIYCARVVLNPSMITLCF